MTDKEKLLAFLAEKGVTYTTLVAGWENGAACRSAWEEWKAQGLKEAPFASFLGIVPATRTIVGCEKTPWPNILHESGHLLAAAEVLGPKDREADWLGWEWAVMRHLGLSRREFLFENRDYCINWTGAYGHRDTLGDLLPHEETDAFFRECLLTAQRLGVVALDGTPRVHPNRAAQ